MQILLTVIAIALLYVWVIVRHDTTRFVVREYDIRSPKIGKAMTLCLLSDLHEKAYGADNRTLFEAIRAIRPDVVLSAGDLVTAHRNPARCNDAASCALMRQLAALFPVYAGSGNHEMKINTRTSLYGDYGSDYEARLTDMGVRVLHDASGIPLSEDVRLCAIDLDMSYFTHGVQKALTTEEITRRAGTPDRERFTVLIAHEPGRFPVYAGWGADLVLSGHVHGGVARVFGRGVIAPTLRLFPFYDGGAFVKTAAQDGPSALLAGGTVRRANRDGVVRHPDAQVIYLKEGMRAMIESRGLGTHSVNVRFLNPGELVVIRLKPAADTDTDTQGE